MIDQTGQNGDTGQLTIPFTMTTPDSGAGTWICCTRLEAIARDKNRYPFLLREEDTNDDTRMYVRTDATGQLDFYQKYLNTGGCSGTINPSSLTGISSISDLEGEYLFLAFCRTDGTTALTFRAGYFDGSSAQVVSAVGTGLSGNMVGSRTPDTLHLGSYTGTTYNANQSWFQLAHVAGVNMSESQFEDFIEATMIDGTDNPGSLAAGLATLGNGTADLVIPMQVQASAGASTNLVHGQAIDSGDRIHYLRDAGPQNTTFSIATAGATFVDPVVEGVVRTPPTEDITDISGGTIGPYADTLVNETTNNIAVVALHEQSRSSQSRGYAGEAGNGIVLNTNGSVTYDSSDFPSGLAHAGSSEMSGVFYHRRYNCIGWISLVPQVGYTSGSSSMACEPFVAVESSSGPHGSSSSVKLGNALSKQWDEGVAHWGPLHNKGTRFDAQSSVQRIAQGGKLLVWFYLGGDIEPGDAVTFTVYFIDYPGAPDVSVKAVGEGSTGGTYPTIGTGYDTETSATTASSDVTIRGSHDGTGTAPTFTVDGTTGTIVEAQITGDMPEDGDCIVFTDSSHPHVFVRQSSRSGNDITFEKTAATDKVGSLTGTTARWGKAKPMTVTVSLSGAQTQHPFVGVEIEVDSGGTYDSAYYVGTQIRKTDATSGWVGCSLGQGGVGIAGQISGSMQVEDEDGNTPIKQWFETFGINCLICSDADSSSSLSDYQDLIDYYTAANADGDLILVRRSFDMNGTSFSNHPTSDTWMDDMAAFAATNSAAYTTARGWGGSYLGQVLLGERFDAYHYTARGVANLAGQWLEGTTTGLSSLQLTPTGGGHLESNMRTYLQAQGVAAPIRPFTGGISDEGDLITYTRISTEYGSHMGGATNLVFANLQYDCWSDTYAGAKDLAESLRLLLHGLRGTIGGVTDSTFVRRVYMGNTFDRHEDPADGEGSPKYRQTIEIRVAHLVTAPTASAS